MPRRNSYTPAQLAWLAERSGTMLRAELTEAFNRRFGQNRSVKAITSTIKREKLPQRAPGYPKGHNITLFSPAQIEFIRTAYRSMDRGEVLRILNTWWDADFTDAQLRAFLKNHKIRSGRTGHFIKGGDDPRTYRGPRMPNSGQFQKGALNGAAARNYQPIGSLRWSKEGYLERKVTDDPSLWPARRWVGEHRLMWEQAHGPIPDGHVVVFLDGDPCNLELDNLRAVPRGVLGLMNKRWPGATHGDARKAAILACELELRANKRRRNAA